MFLTAIINGKNNTMSKKLNIIDIDNRYDRQNVVYYIKNRHFCLLIIDKLR